MIPGISPCSTSADTICFDVFTVSGYEIVSAGVNESAERDSVLVTVLMPTLTVTSVAGPNAGGSFTSLAKEDTLILSAKATGLGANAQISWMIADDSIGQLTVIPPNSITAGLITSVTVPPQSSSRYSALTAHPAPLNKLALSYVVTASSVPPEGATQSAPDTIVQSEVDAMREEYVEYHIPIPPNSTWFTQTYASGPPFTILALNFGDYTWSVVDPALPSKLTQLQNLVGYSLHLTSGFRDPMHYQVHVTPSGGQPHRLHSVHQYGSAADIDTKSDNSRWYSMRDKAWQTHACVEPITVSTNDHLHVDYDRVLVTQLPCPTGWHP